MDAADTQWHLTSPTPYDPPLTYGGWRQSQALGARIASILHAGEAVTDAHTLDGLGSLEEHIGRLNIDSDFGENQGRGYQSHRGKRRKHKVVIHTSPFLRCVQTSIAICAGIAQDQESASPNSHQTHSRPHIMHSGSPHIRAMDGRNSPHLSAIAEPEDHVRLRQKMKIHRILLRVDAFLGEWLSPEYFDKITPPPESKLMVASSKADLLHHGDPISMTYTSNRSSSEQGNFPGGWNSGSAANNKSLSFDDDRPLADPSSLSQSMPRLGRANSHTLGSSPKRSDLMFNPSVEKSPTTEGPTYVPPIPSYAISPSQPIPPGYVFHARDACVKVDNLWDSLRPPLEWGSGGEYGEEWSAMHKRFRKGLHEMISWYRRHDKSETLKVIQDDPPEGKDSGSKDPEDDDGDEMDIVLVLVTHGAGCNALIGALTSQPVLLDIGTASLTMAVRKSVDYRRVSSPQSEEGPASPSRRRKSQIDLGISEEYEVKLTASTEHLRAGSPFLGGSQLQRNPSLPVRERSPYRYERPGHGHPHHSKFGPTKEGFHVESPTNDKLGGLQRSSTTVVRSSGGLWSLPVTKQIDKAVEQESKHPSPQTSQNFQLNAGKLDDGSERVEVDRRERLHGSTNSGRNSPNNIFDHVNQGHSIAPNGLWGAPPQALGTERDQGSKRRWTLSQAS